MGGNCGNGLGDRGLLWGNDPNDLTASVAAGSAYTVTPAGCGLNLGQRWIEDIQTPPPGTGRTRNYDATMPIADVFSCMARAVGVAGCGQEHQLQATRVALIPQTGVNDANNGFLRSSAYLAIVLITDEDDCSASNDNSQNDDMFNMSTKRDVGDTTSLRCAARGHLCGGQPIQNFDPSASLTGGFQGPAYSHLFSDCSAKDKRLINNDPKHPDYAYLPLIDVQDVVDNIKGLKAQPKDKILVSGIIGWPPDPKVDTNLPASLQQNANYRIDKDSTSLPASQQNLWDYMPICSDPNQKSNDGNIYKAYGGLRLKKFVDAFGDKGQVFSICNSNFTNAMTQIGNAIVAVLTPGCVGYPLIDTDPNTPGLQPECRVNDQVPCSPPGKDGCLENGYRETPMPECKDSNGNLIDPTTPDPNSVPDSARDCWYLSYDKTALGCATAGFNGQRISALRKSGTVAAPGTNLAMKCLTCPNADTCNK
jgi:hypothetical protein